MLLSCATFYAVFIVKSMLSGFSQHLGNQPDLSSCVAVIPAGFARLIHGLV